jgi:hypothetical protein
MAQPHAKVAPEKSELGRKHTADSMCSNRPQKVKLKVHWYFVFTAIIESSVFREIVLSDRQYKWANRREIPTYNNSIEYLQKSNWIWLSIHRVEKEWIRPARGDSSRSHRSPK